MQFDVEQQNISHFTEQAYLDYAMYVILDRALPNIGDGLKPVQRRIIYAMSELHLTATAKYKKSARTIGDVLGKFHPHGDSACYEAMVLMAQDFSYRYPFVDGQGNWGSIDDPKSFAAMRYTESRLAKYSEVVLQELGQGTVNWVNNFDGTMLEPQVLPAKLPNVLLNGTTGIAVGMATDIPPHNINEVVAACVHLLEKPKASLDDICNIIPGPDYPTNAEIITSSVDIQEMYKTGQGSIKMRAVYETADKEIVITSLPYMVSSSKILEQIAAQINNKKLPMIVDLRDESDHENLTRLVIVCKSNKIDANAIMDHLFVTTDLEKSYRVNINVIGLDGKPAVKGLLPLLQEWLEFRREIVTKRLNSRLEKVLERLHILDGLLIAFLNIDEVISIIRDSDEPKPALITTFNLSEIQAEAILNLKLRQIAKLEETKIKTEQQELSDERDDIQVTLDSKDKLKKLIKSELKSAAKIYGNGRKSPIVTRQEAKILDITTKLVVEPVTVILSTKGWIRCGKGHDLDLQKLMFKSGDSYQDHVFGMSNQAIVIIDSFGKAFTLNANDLPSARGYGEPLTSKITSQPGAIFTGLTMLYPDQNYLLLTTSGYGFIVSATDFISKNKKGKAIINLNGALAFNPMVVADNQELLIATSNGKLLICGLAEIPRMSKGKGKKIIDISSKDFTANKNKVISAFLFDKNKTIVVSSTKKKLKLINKELKAYKGELGNSGFLLPKGYHKIKEITVE